MKVKPRIKNNLIYFKTPRTYSPRRVFNRSLRKKFRENFKSKVLF